MSEPEIHLYEEDVVSLLDVDDDEDEGSTPETRDRPTEANELNQPSIFDDLLQDSSAPDIHPSVLAGLQRIFEAKDNKKLADDLNLAYPEPQGLQFMHPEPLRDVEAHLKASKAFLALKADSLLVKLAETHSLLARPLTDVMSYVATAPSSLDHKFIAKRLSDAAKTLVIAVKATEAARVELACQAFRVPTSTAKTERGSSLLGQSFAKNVERLRKDKKVLLGEESSNSQRYRPYNKPNNNNDRNGPRKPWKPSNRNDWPRAGTSGQRHGSSRNSGPSTAADSSQPPPPGTPFRSLLSCTSQWDSLTSDEWILSTARGYRISFLTTPCQLSRPHPIHFSHEEFDIVDKLVSELLAKGAVVPISPDRAKFVCNLFLVAKKGTSKYRPVINLKPLNQYIPDNKFKMEGWAEIKEAVELNCYFARIDLKDAFLSIPMHASSQPYLAFGWSQQTYCWTRLPFGLKTSPRVFTKMLKPVASKLRQQGVVVIVYLDDFLLMADSPARLADHVTTTTDLLTSLGYTVNFEKSALSPSQRVTYLGYEIDSTTMQLSVPPEKREQIKRDIETLLKTPRVSLRTLYRILGKLNALTTIVRSIRYHCSSLAHIVSATTRRTKDLESLVLLSPELRSDLLWWTTHLDTVASGPIRPPLVALEVTTDSSLHGWGAWCAHGAAGGEWNERDHLLHISALELKAIFLAVQRLARNYSNTSIAIRTDNTNAMHCINNFGSIRSTTLNALSRQLWSWAFERNVYLRATYLPGVQNELADLLSRTVLDNHSYSLRQASFDILNSAHGPFDIDLFADFSNYKVSTYISWVKDPFAFSIDAFLSRWDSWSNLYAFPPFKLIDRTLTHLDLFPICELTLICPLWSTQPFFPRLLQRCIDVPLLLPTGEDLLLDRTGSPHALVVAQKLRLVAWRLAPLSSREKRVTFWKTLSGPVPAQHTTPAGAIGFVGARSEIPLFLKPL
ncbi:uncharacterized protein LOC108864903 [Galendromus occidentalis]|uniref:Uncharacterized protein LOC108864903 n=1 Tax=Galendromus occidentalis TaxID=34638 RepID=A0AAJ7L642_9ACAR|nr:uncharacterized protein LOC108864903 [Galendromus occidentalis]